MAAGLWEKLTGRRKRRHRREKASIAACMRCGGARLERGRLWDGPITYDHTTSQSRTCLDCGWSGIPLMFERERDRAAYASQIHEEAAH